MNVNMYKWEGRVSGDTYAFVTSSEVGAQCGTRSPLCQARVAANGEPEGGERARVLRRAEVIVCRQNHRK